MKKILILIALIFCNQNAFASSYVCGPDVDGTEIAYTTVVAQENRQMASWAVGGGCPGATDIIDVGAMCDNVILGGQAFCASSVWGNADLNENTASYGNWCNCRRTKMVAGGELLDSTGQWVLLGETSTCMTNCARYCAETISQNVNGLRHAIVVLPAF